MFLKLFASLTLLFNNLNFLQIQTFDYVFPEIEWAEDYQEDELKSLIDALPEIEEQDEYLLQLVNSDNPLETQPYPELATLDGGTYFDYTIYQDLVEMIEVASYEGHYLRVISGYRTMEQQANNRMARYNSYINEGIDPGYAQYLVDLFYAQPDTSEHLTGLAVDILGSDWTSYGGDLHQDYQYELSAQWLAENSSDYGFILRYPYDGLEITGIEFEPWHFRYVGHEHAAFMAEHDLTLEEYLNIHNQKIEMEEE